MSMLSFFLLCYYIYISKIKIVVYKPVIIYCVMKDDPYASGLSFISHFFLLWMTHYTNTLMRLCSIFPMPMMQQAFPFCCMSNLGSNKCEIYYWKHFCFEAESPKHEACLRHFLSFDGTKPASVHQVAFSFFGRPGFIA